MTKVNSSFRFPMVTSEETNYDVRGNLLKNCPKFPRISAL